MKLTEAAVAKIKEVIAEQADASEGDIFIRIGLVNTKPTYYFALDDQKEDDDVFFDFSEVKVALDKTQVEFFNEAVIDFKEDKSFTFSNVLIPQGCGGGGCCGSGGCGDGGCGNNHDHDHDCCGGHDQAENSEGLAWFSINVSGERNIDDVCKELAEAGFHVMDNPEGEKDNIILGYCPLSIIEEIQKINSVVNIDPLIQG